MDFGSALNALKANKRVRRSGWNGKGMWLALTGGSTLDLTDKETCSRLRGAALAHAEFESGGPPSITLGAHIDMRAADESLVIGWLASQTDMLSDDWEIVE